MSTEHQQYSLVNQSDAISAYAVSRGIEIVQTYTDHGRSGVTLAGRAGIKSLLDDVANGRHGFSMLLVYDVSRWGRFQDADESAHYEYVCRRSGVMVHYCAEQFNNDGSLTSTLLKAMKRSMAAEYSRELSVKVFAGQSRLVRMGYRQGGVAGFGLRRQLVDRDGVAKSILQPGEQKSINTDRVILIPGPEDEVAVVRTMFDLYTVRGFSECGIAEHLNECSVFRCKGSRWTKRSVQELLTNPKYVGTNVYNRTSYKLNKKAVRNPGELWVRCDGAFVPIVSLETFIKAQEISQAHGGRKSDAVLLDQLRHLWRREGKLSGALIDKERGISSAFTFRNRFKTLVGAYNLLGYTAHRNQKYNRIKPGMVQRHDALCATLKERLTSQGATVKDGGPIFTINDQFTACVVLSYCTKTPCGPRWSISLNRSGCPDVTIMARLRPDNMEILDYYLIPNIDQLLKREFLSMENSCRLDVYRFDTLDFLLRLGRQSSTISGV